MFLGTLRKVYKVHRRAVEVRRCAVEVRRRAAEVYCRAAESSTRRYSTALQVLCKLISVRSLYVLSASDV